MAVSALGANPPPHVLDGHEYQAPGSGSVRSPCPFLNTLANHGYVNRSGKYITLWSVTKAMMECYNFEFSLALFVASAGIYTSILTSWNPVWFSLDQLNKHFHISIEHDASLTRNDIITGDNTTPDPKLIENLVTYASSPEGLSPKDFAAFRVHRESGYPVDQLPGTIGDTLRTGEIGLIIPSIGRGSFNAVDRRIHPEWAKSFFTLAKLPDDWVKQQVPVAITDVGAVRKVVQERMTAIRAQSKAK